MNDERDNPISHPGSTDDNGTNTAPDHLTQHHDCHESHDGGGYVFTVSKIDID